MILRVKNKKAARPVSEVVPEKENKHSKKRDSTSGDSKKKRNSTSDDRSYDV